MRVLNVWFTVIVSVFVISLGWYVCNGVVMSIAYQCMGDLTGRAFGLLTMVEFVAAWWGPIFDVIVIMWGFLNSREVMTQYV